jgi:hypothetical protein
MPLHHVPPNLLPSIWPLAAPLLQKAIDIDPGSITIEQVEYGVRTNAYSLLVWEEPGEGVTGAVTISFQDLPMYRVAHAHLMGGKAIVRKHVFEEAMQWMRLNGATKAQCWCKDNLVPMYEKMGMTNTHKVMRIDL